MNSMSLMSWLILAFLLNEHAAAEPFNHKAGLQRIRTLELRARVLELKPEVPVYIRWGSERARRSTRVRSAE